MSPIRRRTPDAANDPVKPTIASAVAELAQERAVSERTVWRWLAAMRAADADALPPQRRLCERCGRLLPRGVTIRRRFCDDVCRVYAWRDARQR